MTEANELTLERLKVTYYPDGGYDVTGPLFRLVYAFEDGAFIKIYFKPSQDQKGAIWLTRFGPPDPEGLIPGMQHEIQPEVWMQWGHTDDTCDDELGPGMIHPIVVAPGLVPAIHVCLEPLEFTAGS